jgi:cell division protein FtsB
MFAHVRPYLPTALFALLIFYFGIQAITGERGIMKGQTREVTLAARTKQLEQLRAERIELQTRVRLLSDSNLSRDLLEERARVVLGFADPRDYVIRTSRPQGRPAS